MAEKSTGLQLLHIFVVINFLIGPPLMAALLFWVGENLWAFVSIGVFFLYSALYWMYGVDYFKVEWLQKIKHGDEGRSHPANT